MSYYKAGLAQQSRLQVVGALEKQGPGLSTMVAAGILSGVVLLAIANRSKKAPMPQISRAGMAHQYVVAQYKQRGLPWV